MRLRLLWIIVLSVALGSPLLSQGLEYSREHYAKHEYYVRMRDGVRLFTAVYLPKDTSVEYPILLNRTPYSVAPYGADGYKPNLGPSPQFARDGYIFVYQDVRGRWMSEGEFVHVRPHKTAKSGREDIDESTDTRDTIEWLLENVPGHNGRVGQWGISYPGFYAAAGMIDAHPALKAVSPQAPVTDWFAGDDWHHNGAFFLAHAFRWFGGSGWAFTGPTSVSPGQPLDPGTPDGYEFFLRLGPVRNADEKYFKHKIPFWTEMMRHEAYDEFWRSRNLRQHLKNIRPAVMTVGGWFDAENLFGALEVYRSVEANSPGTFNVLVMGPWVHGGWARGSGESLGDVRFDGKTSDFYREKIEFPFFSFFLKDRGTADFPEAFVFETGANRWRKLDAWPPRRAVSRTLYFQAGDRLSFDPPPGNTLDEYDEYVSDPAKPVPFIPYIAFGMDPKYMVDDQRLAGRRPDVLIFQTDLLEEEVTVAGPLTARLHVSTTGTDSDWIVKLIDVYPDRYPDATGSTDNKLGGYQQMVRGDVMRGKFRNSLEKPEPFVPGRPTLVKFAVPDIYHTFKRGHRIMVQVQSSWFPLVNVNPQRFMNIHEATGADFQKATQRVYRSHSLPSSVEIGVVPRVP